MDDPIDGDSENPLVKLTSLVVLGVGLAGLFLGYDWFWVVFVVGFAAVVPIVKLVTQTFEIGETSGERERQRDHRPQSRTADHSRTGTTDRSRNGMADDESKQDALDTLRNRYARGDLTEAEFERKLEALLETETPESARNRVERKNSSDIRSENEVRTGSAETETDR